MKLRYMIDSIRKNEGSSEIYQPVGLWIQGFGPGLDIEMYYGHSKAAQERESEAVWVINRLVENGQTSLPADFLEYHQQQRSPYDGTFSAIIETEEYATMDLLTKAILKNHAIE